MKRFKKILDYLLTIICWIIGIILVYQSFIAFFDADPWGLALTFYILPLGILGILFLVEAIRLTNEVIKKKKDNQKK